ncbi:hypothetical protein K461DRAFT_265264 [Myriangium duriaei CBS 260.36]|uniref:Uncharacterized protein n=1 Tax=Myriangium duriaei CBS 260.36 TaxID=1168546 RepID=A0A9P4MIA3_9PEZI|nr:hypothetical protein K461DRAFT_265264 [Myriangium duriaei CBS 260.36]
MAVDEHGLPGRTGGLSNGYIKTEPGDSTSLSRIPPRPRRSFVGWVTSLATRLLVWYTIATIIFRCPKDIAELTDDSPRLCKPYLQFHSLVTPYVQPYYTTHIEPHVAKVQPYVDYANERFVQPATTFAQTNYVKYGAPQVENAQKLGKEQWNKHIVPQLTSARDVTWKQYDATLGPHVQKLDDRVRPYYSSLSTSAQDLWELEIRPAYNLASPYVRKGYNEAEKFVVHVFIPYTQWVNGLLWTSMNRHVFPTLQVLYGDNVEPQIMRIKQRLGRYRDEKKVEAAVSSATSAEITSAQSATSFSASTVATPTSATTTLTTSEAPIVASSTVEATTESTASVSPELPASELFAKDLDRWELQVQKAVEQGASHLKERISDICSEQTANQVNKVGDALVIQLEETENSAAGSLKKAIQTSVAQLPEDATEDDVTVASKDIETKIRAAGKQIREKAQQIRTWRKQFDVDTTEMVEAAANSTLETVDNIRQLRLQEIGRRWASHDEIDHKDWSRYNELRRTSNQWRDSIVQIVTNNDSLLKARASASEVEERAMAVVEDAAKELGRLKGVAIWKLRARDDTDDFESKVVPPIVAKAKEQAAQAVSGVSEAVLGTSSQGTIESVTSKAYSLASEAAKSVSESAASLSNAASSSVEPAVSSASSVSESHIESSILAASSAASSMSEKVIGTASKSATDVLESVVHQPLSGEASVIQQTASSLSSVGSSILSKASEQATGLPSKASKIATYQASEASESIIALGGTSSSLTATVASAVSSASSAASAAVDEVVEEAENISSTISSTVSSATPSASSRVLGGVMAQAVPEQKPILDEPLDYDEESDSFLDDALSSGWEELTSMTKAVEEAIYGKTAPGVRASATSVAGDVYQSAIDAASKVFYGPKPTGNQAARFASDKYDEAVSAASRIIYGTPTPAVQAAASAAQSQAGDLYSQAGIQFSQALAYAASQSAVAKSRVSVQISGTPKPIHEQMLASVEAAYSEAASRAGVKYSSVLRRTTAFALPTPPPYESVSSVASSRLAVALSAASAQYSKAKIAAGIEPTPVPQSVLNEAQRRYYEGIGYAHDQYSSYVSSASKAIRSAGLPLRPATTPAYQTWLASAQSQYAAASAVASSALADALASASSVAGVRETTPAQSLLDAASEQYSAAMAQASTILYGTQTPAYEAMMSAASSRYQDVLAGASDSYDSLVSAARSAAGAQTTENSVFQNAADSAASQYTAALLAAQSAYSQVSSDASQVIYGTSTNQVASASSAFSAYVYGTEPAWTEDVAAKAAENWEAIVAAASDRIYGQPTPFYAGLADQASGAAAQVTSAASNAASQVSSAANDQYSAVASLFASLVSGQEPEFTDRVFAQLSSAYYTGAPAAASSASSAAASVYSDASSVISSIFTPPAAIDDILASVSANLDAAVVAASQQVYGTQPGTVEKATSAAASVASDAAKSASSAADQVSSKVSEVIYGTPAPYLEQAQSNANDAITKIYSALFSPTPEPVASQVVSGANDAYASAASVAGDTYSAASSVVEGAASQVSELVFGAERTSALESARKRIEEAVESARVQIEGFAGDASSVISHGTSAVKDTAASVASSASSAAESVQKRVKDEL